MDFAAGCFISGVTYLYSCLDPDHRVYNGRGGAEFVFGTCSHGKGNPFRMEADTGLSNLFPLRKVAFYDASVFCSVLELCQAIWY